ncbi:hypothetical protein X975_10279, partial [Stegodyphus mimosarum]
METAKLLVVIISLVLRRLLIVVGCVEGIIVHVKKLL